MLGRLMVDYRTHDSVVWVQILHEQSGENMGWGYLITKKEFLDRYGGIKNGKE